MKQKSLILITIISLIALVSCATIPGIISENDIYQGMSEQSLIQLFKDKGIKKARVKLKITNKTGKIYNTTYIVRDREKEIIVYTKNNKVVNWKYIYEF